MVFLTKKFLFLKNTIFFFNFHIVPKLFDSLNICFMIKNSILNTFKPLKKFKKIVLLLHLCDFGDGTSYFMTLS